MRKLKIIIVISIVISIFAMRRHTVNQSNGISSFVKANSRIKFEPRVSVQDKDGYLYISSNGLPEHRVGKFPNRGNPHEISEQNYNYKVTKNPIVNPSVIELTNKINFGVAINGVPFDPGAAEWFGGVRNGDWQYEALSGAVELGVDENHAHVQPNGAYHYHGLPSGLLKKYPDPQIIGFAADGFPIMAIKDFNGVVQKSSYRLKKGSRPVGYQSPGGTYDGTFVEDYEYVQGHGTLDRCNGKVEKSKNYPKGIYTYFLTEKFPVIPRCFKGVPDSSFLKKSAPSNQRSRGGHTQKRKGPPREAMQACAGKRKGDNCLFFHHNRSINGTCFSPRDSRELACRPRYHRH